MFHCYLLFDYYNQIGPLERRCLSMHMESMERHVNGLCIYFILNCALITVYMSTHAAIGIKHKRLG